MNKINLLETIKAAYQEMYELTNPECANCRTPYSCCTLEFGCNLAIMWAKEEYGIDLIKEYKTDHPKLPFMGENNCVVPPYLRPNCTLHTCDMSSLGYRKVRDPKTGFKESVDLEWTDKYSRLRNRINELEYKKA